MLAERRPETRHTRHEPEKSILYRTIQEHFETFLAQASQKTDARPFPLHVFQEVEAYMACGILAKGFVRLQCESCKDERLVAFSCKKRGFCPSCGGRRMNEVAAHLVDAVFPNVPVRQWVISYPFSVRYALAYKPAMVTKVLSVYMRVIAGWYKRGARKNGTNGESGAVTLVQRFGGAINLNVHFHSLFVDGVFSKDGVFHQVFPPSDDEIEKLVELINIRVTKILRKNGYEIDDFSEDPLAHEQPVLALIGGASIKSRIGLGEREGQRVRRIGDDASIGTAFRIGKRCAVSDGFSLHANVSVKAFEKDKLEKLIRYTARPPIALERLSELQNGKILYQLKTRYSDGTTHILFDPLELVEKVVALIPPPRANLVRYHGVFAPNAGIRKKVVPEKTKADTDAVMDTRSQAKWADLLKRSFAIDILKCASCGGRLKMIATIKDPKVIRQILGHLGLPTEVPVRAPARAPPQTTIDSVAQDDLSQIPPEAEW